MYIIVVTTESLVVLAVDWNAFDVKSGPAAAAAAAKVLTRNASRTG